MKNEKVIFIIIKYFFLFLITTNVVIKKCLLFDLM